MLYMLCALIIISFTLIEVISGRFISISIYRMVMKKKNLERMSIGERFVITMMKPSIAESYRSKYERLSGLEFKDDVFWSHVKEVVFLINQLELEECLMGQSALQRNVDAYEENLRNIYAAIDSGRRRKGFLGFRKPQLSFLAKTEIDNLNEANKVIVDRVEDFRLAVLKKAIEKISASLA